MKTPFLVLFPLSLFISFSLHATAEVVTYPAPGGIEPSPDFTVTAAGRPVFIHTVPTLNGVAASYGGFDFSGSVDVAVHSTRPVANAAILPASFGITPVVQGNEIRFTVDRPCNLTIEINGSIERVLHLFANPPERDAPKPGDPGVIYFGPGVHEVTTITMESGQTLYLAGGALVRVKIGENEKPTREKDWSGVKNWRTFMQARGLKNITVRGRGVLDFSPLPWHGRSGLHFSKCEGVRVEGITILDAAAWAVATFESRGVRIDNIKQICRRENSDGIDLCNTQDARVAGCFMRNNDDEICVKCTSSAPAQISKNILVEDCVIWNERARGLGITSETRRDVEDVTFRDCDIIHDFSRNPDCAALAILVSDSGTMRNIRFEDIRLTDVKVLLRCWIGADMWGHDTERGRVDGVLFKNITVTGPFTPRGNLIGCDTGHKIENVTFENLRIHGKIARSLEDARIAANEFVEGVRFVNQPE